jgi:hypothetical protein
MKATGLTRYDFVLGGRRVKYTRLGWYVCNECGGGF